MKIELLYFDGCPNHKKAFALLQDILRDASVSASIERIEIKSDEEAERHKFVGSPTIRVNGVDVHPIKGRPRYGKGCRIYDREGVFTGFPSQEMIENAIRSAARPRDKESDS